MDIIEVNNPKDIAEPRASVMMLTVSDVPYAAKGAWETGPYVKLTVGEHAFFMTHELAKTLSTELQVAADLCKVAEGEYGELKAQIVRSFTARIDNQDFDLNG